MFMLGGGGGTGSASGGSRVEPLPSANCFVPMLSRPADLRPPDCDPGLDLLSKPQPKEAHKRIVTKAPLTVRDMCRIHAEVVLDRG